MAINISDSVPTPSVDENTGDTAIAPAAGGDLNLQSGNGQTAINISDTVTNVQNTLQQQGTPVATTATAEAPLGNPSSNGQVLTSTTSGVRSWVTDLDLVNDSDDITEGVSKLFLTPTERTKLTNAPADTNASLAGKLDTASTSVNASITNPGSGDGSLTFINTGATANARRYQFNPRSSDYLELETQNDAETEVSSFRFYHNGNLDVPGAISASGNVSVDAKVSCNLAAVDSLTIGGAGTTTGDAGWAIRNGNASTGVAGNFRTLGFYDFGDATFKINVGSNASSSNLTSVLNLIPSAVIAKQPISAEQGVESAGPVVATTYAAKAASGHYAFQTAAGAEEWRWELEGTNLELTESGVASRVTFETGGNVGIGNTNPAYKLDVSGTGRFTGALTAASYNLSSGSVMTLSSIGRYTSQLQIDTSTFPQLKLSQDTNNQKTGVGYQDESGNYRAATYYNESGNAFYFSMGTSTAVESLSPYSHLLTSAWVFNTPILANQGIEASTVAVSNNGYGLEFYTTSGTKEYAVGLSSGGLRFLENGNTTRFIITAGGNTGVGVITPNYKLHVAGTGYYSGDVTMAGNLTISGFQAAHLGNMSEILRADLFLNNTGGDNPLGTSLTTQHIRDARGRQLIVVGVGALSATMPTISDFGTTNADFMHGENVTIINMNSGSSLSISVPSGYQQAIGRLDITTTSAVSIAPGARVTFVACDGTSYSSWSKKTWCAFDPSF